MPIVNNPTPSNTNPTQEKYFTKIKNCGKKANTIFSKSKYTSVSYP